MLLCLLWLLQMECACSLLACKAILNATLPSVAAADEVCLHTLLVLDRQRFHDVQAMADVATGAVAMTAAMEAAMVAATGTTTGTDDVPCCSLKVS